MDRTAGRVGPWVGWLAFLALALAGCAGTSPARGAGPASAEEPAFPDPARARPRGGTFVNVDNLRHYAPGLSKEQLYALLGPPHFSEGMWGVREWNYLFNFRSARGQEPFQCQFMVIFDREGIAQQAHWKPQSCSAVLDPPAAPRPRPEAAAALPAQPLRLSADALFGFDSATVTAGGRARIERLLQQVREASQVQDILVVGYADRLGDAAHNLKLSQRRAEAVRQVLIEGGVASAAIRAEGRGSTQPLADCAKVKARASLIACLAPDRRVEISASADRRG
ncbi:outer membrane protein assembly factor BamE [Pseudoxanthomonas winnipegensis]|nr:outer membrane protein assembly factor BamE [Pseudoxanthomonas winnipegensis]